MKSASHRPVAAAATHGIIRITNTNAFKRSVLGAVMLSLFVLLCKNKRLYIYAFTIALTLGICYELISLVRKPNKPLSLSGALVTFFVLILYCIRVIPSLKFIYPEIEGHYLIAKSSVILFYCYAVGLMLFIFSLRLKRLSSQLLLLAIAHLAAYVMGSCCAHAMLNIEIGQFYFFYPCILVISNDIFAYVIGKTVGRTPLYALSPNKTLEGFLGASFFTILVGAFLSYIKINHHFMPDSMDTIASTPLRSDIWYLNIPAIYLHNVAFSLYASFVAPFIGFLASAIKRAFNKKDFGAVIPGHGGLTDRMDCQLLMVFFTHFYLRSFLKTRTESIERISRYIVNNYAPEEIESIVANILK